MAGFLLIKRNTKKPQKRLGKPPQDYKLKGRISLINTPQQKLRCQRNVGLYFQDNELVKPKHTFEKFCHLADEILCTDDELLVKFSLMKINKHAKNAGRRERFHHRAYKLFSDGEFLLKNSFATPKLTKYTQPKAVGNYISLNVDKDESEEFFRACQRSARKIAELKIFEDSGSLGHNEFESNPSTKIICIDSIYNKPLGESKENPEKKVLENPENLQMVPKPAQERNEMPGTVPNALEKQTDSKTNPPEKQEEGKSKLGMQAIKDFRFAFEDGKQVGKYNSNIFNPGKSMQQPKSNKRNIILDGSNVAFAHGRNWFSSKGLEYCLTYFKKMGHDVKAVVPSFHRNAFQSADPKILDKWHKKGKIVFMPYKNLTGQELASYDDCFILQLAYEWNAAVVSNHNYQDLIDESPAFKMIVETRVVGFTWFKDLLILPKAPYGRPGPTLDDILHL